MTTLPNILPATVAIPVDAAESTTFSGPLDKTGGSFDRLMNSALAPGATESNPPTAISADNPPQPVKNSKSGWPASGKEKAKAAADNLATGANASEPAAAGNLAVNQELILSQTPVPVPVIPAQKTESTSPTSQNGSAPVWSPLSGQKQQSVPEPAVLRAPETGMSTPVVPEKINSNANGLKAAAPAAAIAQVSQAVPIAAVDLTSAKTAADALVQTAPVKIFPTADVVAQAGSDSGTPAAQQDALMTKTEKTSKTESSAGKILPGAAVSVARQNDLPRHENISGLNVRDGSANAPAAESAGNFSTGPQLSADSVVAAGFFDSRTRAVERTQELIVQHAVRLSASSPDSLQVVIKPGADMQLSLELRQRGDGVEAQATLQRGDFNHLNQQWPELQQQLEQRGIRLAPLVGDGIFFDGSGSQNFQNQPKNSTEPDSFSVGDLVGGVPDGVFAQPAAGARSHRGWESWA